MTPANSKANDVATPALRQFVAPPLYLQGPGALRELAAIAARLGARPLVVTDPQVEQILGERIRTVIGEETPFISLRTQITPSAISALVSEATPHKADVVLGVGGGKSLDAGKAVARGIGARFVSVPTIASNDAPTSRAIALYADGDHRLLIETLERNPDAVLVDTLVIAAAPTRFLRWGIGDALAKAAEAEGCAASPVGRTILGALPSEAGIALARACRDILHAHSAAALRVAGSGSPDGAFEAVIEAVVLLSGLGFENGGLSVAHAMTRGLILASRSKTHAHGEHVAYGLLVQLALDADDATLAREREFIRSVGLPVSLADFGEEPVEQSEIRFLAESALSARQHILNYGRELDAHDLERAVARVESFVPY